MNKVQKKAQELIELASQYGIDTAVLNYSDEYIVIRYAHNLKSRISKSEAGNALVKTWERKNIIPNSSLEPKLSWYKAINDRRAARKG